LYPEISIITVVFNAESLIEPTIQSVLNQSYNNFEYIIIDGASKDKTLEIIEEYKKGIDVLKSEPDKGIYDAMNKGLGTASGKYILFLNAGDRLNTKDTLAEIDWATNADVFYSETILIDSSGKELGTRSQLTTRKLPEKLGFESFKRGMVVSHQSFIAKRSLAQAFDLRYTCSSDIDWCLNILQKSKMNIKLKEPISKYLVGGYSIKNRKGCWKERWQIFSKHYGLRDNLIIHAKILAVNLFDKGIFKIHY